MTASITAATGTATTATGAREHIELDSHRASNVRVALATIVGTTVEWYDFFAYANAAALVFAPAFFAPLQESLGSTGALLVTFATVGISFFFRPLGAAVAGHYGDRIGRKAMLVVTLLTMGAATFLIGVLPTYQQIGVAAPILLILLRILQGFSAGGEWGGAALMAVEHAPADKRGLFGGFPQIGVPGGMLIATVVLSIVNAVTTDEQFLAWGWRIPFLLSVVLIIVGMLIRLGVAESPVVQRIAAEDDQVRLPIVEAIRTSWKPIVLGTVIFAGNGVAGYLVTGGYMLNYVSGDPADGALGLDRGIMMNIVSLAAFCWLLTTLFSAWLSDKIGRTMVFKIGFIALIAWVYPMFMMVQTGKWSLIALGMAVFTIGTGFTYGPLSALYAEMFPAKIRYSGSALAYAAGAVLGGAFSPMISTAIRAHFGSATAPAFYVGGVALLGLIAIFLIKDRTGQPIGYEADAEINAEIEEIAAAHPRHGGTFEHPGY